MVVTTTAVLTISASGVSGVYSLGLNLLLPGFTISPSMAQQLDTKGGVTYAKLMSVEAEELVTSSATEISEFIVLETYLYHKLITTYLYFEY